MTPTIQTLLLLVAVLVVMAIVARRFKVAPPILLVIVGILLALTPGLPRIVPRWLCPSLARQDPLPPWQWLFSLAFVGVRGAVSLAAALAVPLTTAIGMPFPHRNLILFVTFGVIVVTLVGQGLLLPSARCQADRSGRSAIRTMTVGGDLRVASSLRGAPFGMPSIGPPSPWLPPRWPLFSRLAPLFRQDRVIDLQKFSIILLISIGDCPNE
jgi:Sodium/hydrogen exchanger family